MKLLMLDANPKVWTTHEPTGARFLVQALDPRAHAKLRDAAKDEKGEFDPIKFNGLVVEEVVVEWEGVGSTTGALPPSPEHKRTLGEKFPGISGFLFAHATDVRMFLDEVEAAKNV